MDYQSLIDKYYPLDNELKRILLVHSRSVAAMALRICEAHPELSLDKQFVEEAAMLHDIGIFRCNAPGIQCFGTEPYICHGQLGAEILRAEGFPRHARVCERHTGAGLSMTDIQSQHLPIIVPPAPSAEQDNTFWEPFLPETLEEKLICYADKFFSKTRLDNQKTVEQAEKSLAKFGDAGVHRFREWRHLFE
jgi:uncharacterized protein